MGDCHRDGRSVLKINPFDQPNVQESKDNTNRLLAVVREQGRLPEEEPSMVNGRLTVYAESAGSSLAGSLANLFREAGIGDYFAILAYLPEDAIHRPRAPIHAYPG